MDAIWRAKGLVRWLILDPLPFWAAVILPMLGLMSAWVLPGEPELRVRIAGFAITLAGVGLVVKGIRDKRRHFGRPSYFAGLRAWLARLPALLTGPKSISGQGTVHLGSLSVAGSGHVRAVASGPTLEERVLALEENVKSIDQRITGLDAEHRKNIDELREALKAESAAREQMHRSIREQLEDLSAGGLDFEAVGVVWVIAGSAFSTFPGEIAAGLGNLM